jgi:hypothetical protein
LSLALLVSLFAGPESAPPEVFAPENVQRVLSLA